MHHHSTEKKAWYHHWMKLSFDVIDAQLSPTEQINLLDVLLVPQVFNAHRFNLSIAPYGNINKRVSWRNKQAAFEQAHPDSDLT